MSVGSASMWGNLSSILPALTTLAGLMAAILAWVAKLRWSKEFAAAKDAEIAALKTQVGNLTTRAFGDSDVPQVTPL